MELHKLETYDIEVINSFIKNEIEESIHIEFKSCGALSKKDNEKKEVSKDVAAFSNSDGGIIVYGIEEKNHKAHALSFIDGNEYTKEWLEQIINSTISRNISELRIFPIRNNSDISQSIYVVQIPASIDAPHMSRDKKYYKRFNFESVAMEEYEVRQLYGRKVQSKLILDKLMLVIEKNSDEDKLTYTIEVDVHNEGKKVEKNYKVNLYFIDSPSEMNLLQDKSNSGSDVTYTRMEHNRFKASIKNNNPIYPNEYLNSARVKFTFNKKDLENVIKNLKLEVRLYYSNGEDFMEYHLGEIIKSFE